MGPGRRGRAGGAGQAGTGLQAGKFFWTRFLPRSVSFISFAVDQRSQPKAFTRTFRDSGRIDGSTRYLHHCRLPCGRPPSLPLPRGGRWHGPAGGMTALCDSGSWGRSHGRAP